MKIAIVILHADPARGGAERYTVDLANALAKRGHEVWLAHAATIADNYSIEHKSGSFFRHAKVKATGATRASRYRRFLKSLDSLVADQSFDIIHSMLPVNRCHVYQPHAGIEAENQRIGHLKERGAMGQKLTWLGNRLIGRRKIMAAVEHQMLTGPNPPTVICLSDAQKKIVLSHYPSIEPKLVRLFNAVDLDRFSPAGKETSRATIRKQLNVADDQVLALLISQNWELKGVRQAIEAMAKVADPRLVLAIVGRENPSVYQALAKSLGIPDQIRFPGPTTNAPDFYRAVDFFVLPTRSDVCSLVVLEALATGLPVISTAANGACEIMNDGVQGFVLADSDDVAGLAERMRKMLDAPSRAHMSAASLALRPQLSYERHLDQIIQIYGQSRL